MKMEKLKNIKSYYDHVFDDLHECEIYSLKTNILVLVIFYKNIDASDILLVSDNIKGCAISIIIYRSNIKSQDLNDIGNINHNVIIHNKILDLFYNFILEKKNE